MKFKNNTKDKIRIRLDDPKQTSGYKWVWLNKGQTIDIHESYGKALNLTQVGKSDKEEPAKTPKSTSKAPEEKPKEVSKKYLDRLLAIDGVGKKTAKDIINVFPTEESLQEAVDAGEDIPIRDDLATLVKEEFE